MDKQIKNTAIDEYIAQCRPEVQDIMRKIRDVIKRAAPNATEKISYPMPAFYDHGNLVYFAAFKNHIGFYPTSNAMEVFSPELTEYKSGKGSVQFPLGKPIPYDLIRRIAEFRVSENTQKCTEHRSQP